MLFLLSSPLRTVLTSLVQTQGNPGGNCTFLRGLFLFSRCENGVKLMIYSCQKVRNRPVFTWGLRTVALLRCLFWERKSVFYTFRVACAASILRNRIPTGKNVKNRRPGAQGPAYLTLTLTSPPVIPALLPRSDGRRRNNPSAQHGRNKGYTGGKTLRLSDLSCPSRWRAGVTLRRRAHSSSQD